MNNKLGFSLIELLVVISIIAILSTIGYTSYTAVTRNGRDTLRKTNLEQVRSALEIYRAQGSVYPTAAPPATCGSVSGLATAYINPFPSDPTSGNSYCYRRVGSGSGYELCAFLENGAASGTFCNSAACSGSGCNYQVTNP